MTNSRYLASLSLLMLSASPAAAQSSVVIWPVDPQIKATEQATALWLENRGTTPVTLQVRSFAWDQSAGEDDYRDQDAVVASPPIAQVGPGQRQLIRVIRRAPDTAGEHAYRLVIDELPQPKAAPDAEVSAQLSVQMRYSIPLFTHGPQSASPAPRLTSHVELAGGKRWLAIANSGTKHARLTDLRAGNSGKQSTTIKAGLVGYVLPGATMRWELPADAAPATVFTVAVNGDEQTLGQSS